MQSAVAASNFPVWNMRSAKRPRFSIVIPVRNRRPTIAATLQTCLAQEFTDFEIVVSDNLSSDGTFEIVNSIPDPRIKLFSTPSFYAMTDNFEFALRQTNGQYILFIGGDDGFYPWSLAYLNDMISLMPSECYDWNPPQFIWPHEKKAILYCDIAPHLRRPWRETNDAAEARLAAPIAVTQPQLTGFNIYHGCVTRELITRVITAQGRYFEGPSPDLSASLDNLLHADGTVHLGAPVSIAGLSRLSNGWAFTAPEPTQSQEAIRAEFVASNTTLRTRDIPINAVSTTVGPYLGGLVSFWFKKYGNLKNFPHEPWRALYAQQLGLHYRSELESHCAAYSAFSSFLKAHGAAEAAPLTPDDIPKIEVAPATNPKAPPLPDWAFALTRDMRLADPPSAFRALKLFQWENVLMAEVESHDTMITVADHAALIAQLLPVSGRVLAELDDEGRMMLGVAARMRAATLIAGMTP
jgi:glycosyltransferase involved in cell wall biosynthesis